ncbi:MAG: Hsp20/alpha crystallin family protein [Dehalococcoidia bacterium]|nr:Hsp20/alpha crystallin family protein [Dehalococcoidia bacterium]
MSAERWRPRRGQTPLRPLRELDEMRRRFEDDIARPFLRDIWERIPQEMKEWAPSIDVYEKGDAFVVKVELPGMKLEDIDVSVSNDMLVIKGEKQPESGVEEANCYRSEITYGSFYRSVEIPSDVDAKNVEAVYEEGVLYITFHKALETKAEKITITPKKGTA